MLAVSTMAFGFIHLHLPVKLGVYPQNIASSNACICKTFIVILWEHRVSIKK
jgi:hypothetical protein